MEESSWDYWHSEQLVLCRDDAAGPARGDRDRRHDARTRARRRALRRAIRATQAAIVEAQRLAAAMTLKNAFAGLPFGGAKSVIIAPAPEVDRRALMQRFGEFVIAHRRRLPAGCRHGHERRRPAGDGRRRAPTSPATTRTPRRGPRVGVAAAVRAAVEHVDQREGIEGARVLIQGAGHVGAALAHDLAGDGAEIVLADIDAERAAAVAAEVGGSTVPRR